MGTGKSNAGGNPVIPSHPGGTINTPSRFMLQKPEISAGLMGLLGSQQTFPYNGRVERAKE